MPKTNIDFSRTIIYKIQHIENDELIYVGQTTDFSRRKSSHKRLALCEHPTWKDNNVKLYKMIRNNGGWENFKMILIKEYPCTNRREAEAEEFRIIRELKATMNTVGSYTGISLCAQGLTPKEYRVKYDAELRRKLMEFRQKKEIEYNSLSNN